jgi:hypothetical protein
MAFDHNFRFGNTTASVPKRKLCTQGRFEWEGITPWIECIRNYTGVFITWLKLVLFGKLATRRPVGISTELFSWYIEFGTNAHWGRGKSVWVPSQGYLTLQINLEYFHDHRTTPSQGTITAPRECAKHCSGTQWIVTRMVWNVAQSYYDR